MVSRENSSHKIKNENILNLNLEAKISESPTLYQQIFQNSKIINSIRSSIENMPPNDSKSYRQGLPYPPFSADLVILSPNNNHSPLESLINMRSPREKRLSINHQMVQQALPIQKTQPILQQHQQQYFDKLRLEIMSPEQNRFETLNNKCSINSKLSVNTNRNVSAFKLDTLIENKQIQTSKNEDNENKHVFIIVINNGYLTKLRQSGNIGDFSFNKDFNDPNHPNPQFLREVSPKSRFSRNALHNNNLINDKHRLNDRVKNFGSITRNNSAPLIEMKKGPDDFKFDNINAFRGQMVLNSSNGQRDIQVQNNKMKRKVIMINKALGSKFACCEDTIKYSPNEIETNKNYRKGRFFNDNQVLMQKTSYFPNIPQ